MPPSSNSKSRFNFDVVVAMDRACGIARDGDMPWHLPEDLKYFAKLTTGEGADVVIMGRKTWETIPDRFRPLPRRRNIVITRQMDYAAEGAEVYGSLEQALTAAAQADGSTHVIGGAQIYALALEHPDCREAYITEIDHDFGCDVFFPALPGFGEPEMLGEGQKETLRYRFTRRRRVSS
ncbi:MAG: dihydrofolate reductase [Planctomycetota bacterium]